VKVGLHLVLVPGVGVDNKPASRLVKRADDGGLVVVVVEFVVILVGDRFGRPRVDLRRLDGRLLGDSVGDFRRVDSLDGSGTLIVTERCGGFILGHSHTDHVLNSQKTPLPKA
jgi:hypothetical protein